MSDRKRSRRSSKRGKRYSAGEKEKLLKQADRLGIGKTARKSGVSAWSLYRWRRERELLDVGRGGENGAAAVVPCRPPKVRVSGDIQKRVLSVWRHNPGFGPSQIRNQLRRIGVRCDTKTIRKILLAHGYTPPEVRPPRLRENRRFEASRPLELLQMDVLVFRVHAERVYLFLALDDHSRFIVGWELLQRESMEAAMGVLEEAIRRYGKPEAVLTDRGATFHSWSGIGRFDRFLESYGIEHILASAEHPQTCGL